MGVRFTICVALLGWAQGCGLILEQPSPEPDASVDASADAAVDGAPDTPPIADECNGRDDDGDGLIDESPTDPSLGTPCFEGPLELRGVGACVEGQVVCEGGALVCAGAGSPSEEVCNGVDDDCDGARLPEEGLVGCPATVTVPGATRVLVEVEPPTLDVQLNLDTTGSMGGVMSTLQSELSGFIVPGVRALFPDAAFGVSTFDDFPVSPFGAPDSDVPFMLHRRVTTREGEAQLALDALVLHSGADGPESGIEALFQLATGAGRAWPGGSVAAMDCAAGFDPGAGHGRVGGACFRSEALPVIVHFTDNSSHNGPDYPFGAANDDETVRALRSIGARVVGIWSGFASVHEQPSDDWLRPLGLAVGTDAMVPTCAFDGTPARELGRCGPTQCCTGIDGAGVPALEGRCPLAFDVSSTGTGLEEAIVAAVAGLTGFATFDLSVELLDEDGDLIDATCFVQSAEVVFVDPPGGDCGVPPRSIDTDGDGLVDTVADATPGTRASFELTLDNRDGRDVDADGDYDEACGPAGRYAVTVRILPAGSAALVSRRVTIVVE